MGILVYSEDSDENVAESNILSWSVLFVEIKKNNFRDWSTSLWGNLFLGPFDMYHETTKAHCIEPDGRINYHMTSRLGVI